MNFNGTSLDIINYNDIELDKVTYNDTTVYQRITVNYYCENSIYKSSKIVSGNSIDLSSSNAASKSGWTFIGWRQDKTANSSVLSTLTAGTNDINLYAIYRQTITLSYNGNGNTGGSTAAQSDYRYYNNGNTTNPTFTLRSNGFSKTNYKFVNWRQGSTSGTAYNAGASITLSSNTIFYASWEEMYKAVEVRYQNSHTCEKHIFLIFPDTRYNGENWPPTIPANSCISFVNTSTRFCEVIANCNCTVTFSTARAYQGYGSANTNQWRYYSADGSSECRTSLFLNEEVYKDLVYEFFEGLGDKYFSWSVSVNLSTGQKASIRNWGGYADNNARMGIWGTLVIKATRR